MSDVSSFAALKNNSLQSSVKSGFCRKSIAKSQPFKSMLISQQHCTPVAVFSEAFHAVNHVTSYVGAT